jgi:putative chitinase
VITLDELHQIMPYAGGRAALFIEPLNAAMQEFDINTNVREAAFLAQIAHESGSLKYVRELADGTAYELRHDLGNTEPGDGPRYRGRGLVQITGRANYQACGDALGVDLVGSPELLERTDLACRSAAWFWKTHGLNELADKGDFKLITKRINGGYNGYQDRLAYYERAQRVLA